MGEHTTKPKQQNIVRFPTSKKERKRILRESEDKRVRICALLRAACGWLLVIGAFLFLLANYRLLTPSSIRSLTSYVVAGLQQREGDMTTIAYENGSFTDGALFGTGLAYVDGDTLYVAKPGGATSLKQPLGFASPSIETSRDFILAFDRGGTGAKLFNSVAAAAELTLSSPILTGSIGQDGHFTLITDEQGYRTAAAVYDTRGNEVFKWNSSEYYIVSAALSPDGKTLAALAFQQNGISLDSHVLFFNIAKGEQIGDAALTGSLGMELCYLSGGTVAALCDDGVYLVTRKGESDHVLPLSTSELLAFSMENGTLALAARSYSGDARSQIYILRSNGKLAGPFPVTEEPSAVAASNAGAAVLTASGVSLYDRDFAPLWSNSEAVGARRVLLTDDGTVFALYAKNARLFTAHSERSEDISHAN